MVCIIIFGTRFFGKCDYFKLNENSETECYIRTKFFHISFLPLCPEFSYIGKDDDQLIMKLPELSGKSIGWAWLRSLLAISSAIMFVIALLLSFGIYGDGTAVWKYVVSWIGFAILLILAIFVLVYKHKADPETAEKYRQEILDHLSSRTGTQIRRRPRAAAAQPAPVAVVVATGNTKAGCAGGASEQHNPKQQGAPPAYGYDQGPVQSYVIAQNMPPQQPQAYVATQPRGYVAQQPQGYVAQQPQGYVVQQPQGYIA